MKCGIKQTGVGVDLKIFPSRGKSGYLQEVSISRSSHVQTEILRQTYHKYHSIERPHANTGAPTRVYTARGSFVFLVVRATFNRKKLVGSSNTERLLLLYELRGGKTLLILLCRLQAFSLPRHNVSR